MSWKVTEIPLPLCYFRAADGARLAYRELGQGLLIRIHGYMGSSMSMIDGGLAGGMAGRGYRVILPDLRGHGASARPHEPAAYPPDVLADDGLALIGHLGAYRLRPGGLLPGRPDGNPDPRPRRGPAPCDRGRAGAGGRRAHRRTRR